MPEDKAEIAPPEKVRVVLVLAESELIDCCIVWLTEPSLPVSICKIFWKDDETFIGLMFWINPTILETAV